jgi:hypothetical protein
MMPSQEVGSEQKFKPFITTYSDTFHEHKSHQDKGMMVECELDWVGSTRTRIYYTQEEYYGTGDKQENGQEKRSSGTKQLRF